jgi:hypothetical protein
MLRRLFERQVQTQSDGLDSPIVSREPLGQAYFMNKVTLQNGREAIEYYGSKARTEGAAGIVDSDLGFNVMPETLAGPDQTLQEFMDTDSTRVDYKSDAVRERILRIGLFDYVVGRSDIRGYESVYHSNHLESGGEIYSTDYGDAFQGPSYSPFYLEYVNFTNIPKDLMKGLARFARNTEHQENLRQRLIDQGVQPEFIDGMYERVNKLVEVLHTKTLGSRMLKVNKFDFIMAKQLNNFAKAKWLRR